MKREFGIEMPAMPLGARGTAARANPSTEAGLLPGSRGEPGRPAARGRGLPGHARGTFNTHILLRVRSFYCPTQGDENHLKRKGWENRTGLRAQIISDIIKRGNQSLETRI